MRESRGYGRSQNTPAPVERVELSGKHAKLRLALTIAFLALGVFLIGYGLVSVLNREPGWQEISVSSDASVNCGPELKFEYEFTRAAAAESRQITALYTQAAVRAYAMFQPRLEMDGVKNVHAVNAGVNSPVQVEPELYAAFALLEEAGSRDVFLAPVYEEYEQIFRSGSDAEMAPFDPFESGEEREYLEKLLPFVQSPEHVSLSLLGDDTVLLHVSDEYLAFASEYGIGTFVDFYWMKNAFIVDYIAGVMAENGFTNGYITSYDGFTCNLDTRGTAFSLSVTDRTGADTRLAAVMDFTKPVHAVCLRDFPLRESIADYYYTLESGQIRTPYVDAADGLCRAAVPELTAWSYSGSCAQILVRAAPLYIADALDADALGALKGEGIHALYAQDDVIHINDDSVSLREVYHGEAHDYKVEYTG